MKTCHVLYNYHSFPPNLLPVQSMSYFNSLSESAWMCICWMHSATEKLGKSP